MNFLSGHNDESEDALAAESCQGKFATEITKAAEKSQFSSVLSARSVVKKSLRGAKNTAKVRQVTSQTNLPADAQSTIKVSACGGTPCGERNALSKAPLAAMLFP